MRVQVDHRHYSSREYNQKGRFNSFWHQVDEVTRLNPTTVIEIGTGSGLVNTMLRDSGITVTTLDFDPAVNPDILGSVTEMPVKSETYDLALCCQVLEHLPYDQFVPALQEIRRVVRKNVVLSLPDLQRVYRFDIQLPLLGDFRFLYTIPRIRPLKWTFNGEHYWNISCEGYPLRRIKADIDKAGFVLERTYCVFEYSWHRFFILTKR